MKLSMQTERWDIALEGEDRASVWSQRAVSDPPRLQVRSGNRDAIVQLLVDGVVVDTSARSYDGVGCRLVEETSYRLTVSSRLGHKPILMHLDPSLISGVLPIPGHADVISGSLNFKSQVGDSKFVLSDGESELEFVVEVRSSKLDYRTDYEDLVQEVSGLARQLVLEFLRATTSGAEVQAGEDVRRIEWLLLLREEVRSLERALTYISANPYRQLSRELLTVPAESIRRPSAVTRRAVQRGLGDGPWATFESMGRYRSRLPAMAPHETLDIAENRWLRLQLERVVRQLAQLLESVETPSQRQDARTRSPRTVAIIRELKAMEEALLPFLSRSPLVETSPPVPHSFTSLTLQGRPGYREAYQSLLRLNMSLVVGGEALDVPLSDLSELYEIWCFLAVVREVSKALGIVIDVSDLVELRDTGLRLSVVPGLKSTVNMTSDKVRAKISYNRAYQMLSGRQRPDIVIELLRDDLPPVMMLLDAKYRLDTSPEYVETFKSPGPPADAVGQLHRYRDAIIVKYSKYVTGRPVVRAAALFPLGAEDSGDWSSHPYFKSIDKVGIGALPFLPTNMSWVHAWIRDGIQSEPRVLAWPGPDFIAWSRIGRGQEPP